MLSDNQEKNCISLTKNGAALNIGRAESIERQELADAVFHIATNPEVYSSMVQAAFTVTDGQGCQRVLSTVLTKA